MSISDFFVSTEWLANHIGEPNLKIVDATVLYDPSLSKDGVDHLESGEPGYLESHIPGALFADLFDLNDSNSSIPFMFTQPQVFAEKLLSLGSVKINRLSSMIVVPLLALTCRLIFGLADSLGS